MGSSENNENRTPQRNGHNKKSDGSYIRYIPTSVYDYRTRLRGLEDKNHQTSNQDIENHKQGWIRSIKQKIGEISGGRHERELPPGRYRRFGRHREDKLH